MISFLSSSHTDNIFSRLSCDLFAFGLSFSLSLSLLVSFHSLSLPCMLPIRSPNFFYQYAYLFVCYNISLIQSPASSIFSLFCTRRFKPSTSPLFSARCVALAVSFYLACPHFDSSLFSSLSSSASLSLLPYLASLFPLPSVSPPFCAHILSMPPSLCPLDFRSSQQSFLLSRPVASIAAPATVPISSPLP